MRIQLLVVTAAVSIAGLVACGDSPEPPVSPSPPPGPLPTSISITGPAEVAPGATAQFTAIATYADGTTGDVTASSSWTSQNTGFLRSLGSGRYEGVAVGDGRATVNFRGRSSSKPVIVVPAGTFKLSGLIRDVAGGVGGVDVQVVSGTSAGLSTKSTSSGAYAFFGVAGAVGLRVSAPGYTTQDLSVTVTGHQEHSFNLQTSGSIADVSGQWTLSISTSGSCSETWPADARRREVVANITQQDTRLNIKFQNVPNFVFDSAGRIASDVFSMTLFTDFYYADWGLTLRVGTQEWVGVNGEFRGVASGSVISGTLTGNFNYYVGNATFPNGNPRTCPADSAFEFRR
jgi:hypothetical protein